MEAENATVNFLSIVHDLSARADAIIELNTIGLQHGIELGVLDDAQQVFIQESTSVLRLQKELIAKLIEHQMEIDDWVSKMKERLSK